MQSLGIQVSFEYAHRMKSHKRRLNRVFLVCPVNEEVFALVNNDGLKIGAICANGVNHSDHLPVSVSLVMLYFPTRRSRNTMAMCITQHATNLIHPVHSPWLYLPNNQLLHHIPIISICNGVNSSSSLAVNM